MDTSTITSKSPAPAASETARGRAADALKSAKAKGYRDEVAVAEARRLVWRARWRAVVAGDDTMAETWLDALAHLGDKGGIVALAERAKAAVKGDRA